MKPTPGRARLFAAALVAMACLDAAAEPTNLVIAVLALISCVLAGVLMWFANDLARRKPGAGHDVGIYASQRGAGDG